MLGLAALLSGCPDPEVQKALASLGSNRAAAAAELRPLLAKVLRRGAENYAQAFGCSVAEVLAFCPPASPLLLLRGHRGEWRRLDRLWGGEPMMLLESAQRIELRWPYPGVSQAVALRGRLRVDQAQVGTYGCLSIAGGQTVLLPARAQILIRRPPLVRLLTAAAAAGFDLEVLIAEASGQVVNLDVRTAAGRLRLDCIAGVVSLNGRTTRLSRLEATALELLLRSPGEPITRARLAEALDLDQPRAVDRIALRLRNKLGDGVITTLYGTGYMIETSPDPGVNSLRPSR